MVSKVGSRIPLYCSGVGKAMAAGMEESQIHKLWDACTHKKLTRHTITDYDTFLKEVKEARKNAYAATEWISFANKYMRHDIGKAIDEA